MIFLMSESGRRAHVWLRNFRPDVDPRGPLVVMMTTHEDCLRRTRGRRFQPGVDQFVWESHPQMNYDQMCAVLGVLASMGFDQDEGFCKVWKGSSS